MITPELAAAAVAVREASLNLAATQRVERDARQALDEARMRRESAAATLDHAQHCLLALAAVTDRPDA